MSAKLTGYLIADDSDFRTLTELPLTTLSKEWHGQPAIAKCHFALACSSTHLFFRAVVEKAAIKDEDSAPGSFAEGLWKFDCAELFIAENSSTRYQEFNLAPQGAWWSTVFDSYRSHHLAKSDLDIKLYSKIQANRWEAGFFLNKERLTVTPNRANVSFVLAQTGVDGSISHQYLSFTKLSSAEPDFHLAREFQDLIWQA